MNSMRTLDLGLVPLWVTSIALAVAVTLLLVQVSDFGGARGPGYGAGQTSPLAIRGGSGDTARSALPDGSYELQAWTDDRLTSSFVLDAPSSLVLNDRDGTERVAITFDEILGTPQVVMSDERGEAQAVLSVDETGPWVAVLDERGQSQWIPLTSYDGSKVVLAGDVPAGGVTALAPQPTEPVVADLGPNWPHDPNGTAWFSGGAYHLLVRYPERFVAVGAPTTPASAAMRDVTVSASFRKIGGPSGGGAGIIVRDEGPGLRDGWNQTGRFYLFAAGDEGDYGIWRRDLNRWVDVFPWTPSDAVRPGGGSNELTVVASGEEFVFLVNGAEVARISDSTLGEGGVGVFASGASNEVLVERFSVEAQ